MDAWRISQNPSSLNSNDISTVVCPSTRDRIILRFISIPPCFQSGDHFTLTQGILACVPKKSWHRHEHGSQKKPWQYAKAFTNWLAIVLYSPISWSRHGMLHNHFWLWISFSRPSFPVQMIPNHVLLLPRLGQHRLIRCLHGHNAGWWFAMSQE